MRRRLVPIFLLTSLVVVLAAPAGAHVSPVRDLLPDGDTRPIIVSATLSPPQRHNALLEADITIEAYDNDAIDRYEYRWIGSESTEPAAVEPSATTVSYGSVMPATQYALQVRAIDTNGWDSDWFDVWEGSTPPPPNLVVAGDSVASGYSRQWFTGSATCRDGAYSYGETVAEGVADHLPDAWAPRYFNVAWPGAGVEDMLNGGLDSCSQSHPSQIGGVVSLANPETWNVVVITAGINSTNWTDVIAELVMNTTFSLTEDGDQGWCRVAVDDHWNLAQRTGHVTDAVRSVVETLHSQTNAAVHWTSYYPIGGTKLAPGWTPIGAECAPEMSVALDRLHGAILSGLGEDAAWIDVSDGAIETQPWAGWPHPDRTGHVSLGERIARAIAG
ncbi:MAG: hypothetical protein ABFR89_10185 [Actinomycetota bacterium]